MPLRRALFLGLFTGLLVFVFYQLPHQDLTPLRLAGLALAAVALPLWLLARWQLGDSFSVSAQARKLVTHGIYARIRNPVYCFGTLFIAGMIIYSGKYEWLL